MTSYTLVIGNKNISSWSLRAWLMLKATGAAFKEISVALDRDTTRQEIARYSPSGKVPALIADGHPVWDSLAIGEFLAERFPAAGLWPEDTWARAHARSASAEMHSGFQALRTNHPMNLSLRRKTPPAAEVRADVTRIETLWREARERFGKGGDFLYGHPTLADFMYLPVATRFVTYDFPVSGASRDYMDALLALPAFAQWREAALTEG